MLQQVRGALKGVVAWIVIILLVLAFGLWGIPEVSQMGSNAALTVGGKKYSSQYVQAELTRAMQAQRNETGQVMTLEQARETGFHDQVLSNIITRSALEQFHEAMGLETPSVVVRDFLRDDPNYQDPVTGEFDETRLRTILAQNNLTPSQFEELIGQSILQEQFFSAFILRAAAPKPMVDPLVKRDVERREITYLVVSEEMAGKPAEPTPNDLQEYYAQNAPLYTAPEYRQFDLLLIRNEDFRDEVSVPEEEIRRLYDFNLERRYQTPERRTLYQFSFDSEEDAAAAAADLRATGALESAAEKSGTTLQSAKLENSTGGEILDPAVREAAFSSDLSAGMISEPIAGAFGWTVVQIESVIEGSTTPFEEVREEIEEQYLSNDMRRAVANAIDIVEEERDRGLDLASAGSAAGLESTLIGPIDRFSFDPGGAIIDMVPGEALEEAFLLEEGEESQPIQLSTNDGYLFVAVREITPDTLKPFETVEDEVVEAWRRQERADRVSQTVRDLRASISEGVSFEEAASPFNEGPTTTTIDRRFSEQAISPSLVEQIFTAKPGDVVSAPAGDSAAQIIAQIGAVSYGDAASAQDQAAFSDVIGVQLDQELLDVLVQSIVEAYPTKTNAGQLEAVFGGEL